MVILKKVGAWSARIGGGLVMIWLILSWVEFQTEKRVVAARLEGKTQCEAEYYKNTILNNLEVEAKTQEILKYKRLLKEQRKDLSDDCKAIYNIDLSICRNQLCRN